MLFLSQKEDQPREWKGNPRKGKQNPRKGKENRREGKENQRNFLRRIESFQRLTATPGERKLWPAFLRTCQSRDMRARAPNRRHARSHGQGVCHSRHSW